MLFELYLPKTTNRTAICVQCHTLFLYHSGLMTRHSSLCTYSCIMDNTNELNYMVHPLLVEINYTKKSSMISCSNVLNVLAIQRNWIKIKGTIPVSLQRSKNEQLFWIVYMTTKWGGGGQQEFLGFRQLSYQKHTLVNFLLSLAFQFLWRLLYSQAF